ncbi:MAG: spermidine/putrescine ABC transporter substrate-binding protein [Clostridia bacterium]|nr:spermidine/putrescine ABC transporter substrate-binding protein [Clostridia bacterium]
MKKLACLLLAILFVCSLSAPVSAENVEPDTTITLNVYNWGEYIDPSVTDLFTEETGIKVNYKNFTDNESMYAVLSSGAASYDIVVPSDYMVGKLIQEGMLAKLDFNNIPNFKYINADFKNLEYDPDNAYSVPYTWGTVGIFYNTKYVKEEDLAQGWDLLWDENYSGRIFMFDNQRDAFGIALNKLGYSMNTPDPAHWDAAYEALVEQKPLLHQYVMDQVFDKMINEEGWIAPYYSGDGIIMMDEEEGNPAIDFFVPESGTNRFVDALCVPASSPHKREAEMYINFLCRTDIALMNAEYIGYSTPHVEAQQLLDPEIGQNENFYPPEEILKKTEIFLTLPQETGAYMDQLWMRLKLADPRWGIFTAVVGVLAVGFLGLFVVRFFKKRRKR